MAREERHPAIEADIERGWWSLTIACVLILLLCVGTGALVLLSRHRSNQIIPPPAPLPSVVTTDERIEV